MHIRRFIILALIVFINCLAGAHNSEKKNKENLCALAWKSLPTQALTFHDGLRNALYTLPALDIPDKHEAHRQIIELSTNLENTNQALLDLQKGLSTISIEKADNAFKESLQECFGFMQEKLTKAIEILKKAPTLLYAQGATYTIPRLIRDVQDPLLYAIAMRNGLKDIVQGIPLSSPEQESDGKKLLKEVEHNLKNMQQKPALDIDALVKDTVSTALSKNETLDQFIDGFKKLLIEMLNDSGYQKNLLNEVVEKVVENENHRKLVKLLLERQVVQTLLNDLTIDEELRNIVREIIKGNVKPEALAPWFLKQNALTNALQKIDTNDVQLQKLISNVKDDAGLAWIPNFLITGVKWTIESQRVRSFIAQFIPAGSQKHKKSKTTIQQSHNPLLSYLHHMLTIDQITILNKPLDGNHNPFIGMDMMFRFNGQTQTQEGNEIFIAPLHPYIPPYRTKNEKVEKIRKNKITTPLENKKDKGKEKIEAPSQPNNNGIQKPLPSQLLSQNTNQTIQPNSDEGSTNGATQRSLTDSFVITDASSLASDHSSTKDQNTESSDKRTPDDSQELGESFVETDDSDDEYWESYHREQNIFELDGLLQKYLDEKIEASSHRKNQIEKIHFDRSKKPSTLLAEAKNILNKEVTKALELAIKDATKNDDGLRWDIQEAVNAIKLAEDKKLKFLQRFKQGFDDGNLSDADLEFFIDAYAPILTDRSEKIAILKPALMNFAKENAAAAEIPALIIKALNKKDFLQELLQLNDHDVFSMPHFIFRMWIQAKQNKIIEEKQKLKPLIDFETQKRKHEKEEKECSEWLQKERGKQFFEELKAKKSKSLLSKLFSIKGWYQWFKTWKTWWQSGKILRQQQKLKDIKEGIATISEEIDNYNQKKLLLFDLLYNADNKIKLPLTEIRRNYYRQYLDKDDFWLTVQLAQEVDDLFWYCIPPELRPASTQKKELNFSQDKPLPSKKTNLEQKHHKKKHSASTAPMDPQLQWQIVQVPQQEGLTCGAHALCNVYNIGQKRLNNEDNFEIDAIDRNAFFDTMYELMAEDNPDLHLLTEDQLKILIKHFEQQYKFPIILIQDVGQYIKGENPSKFVLENLKMLKEKLINKEKDFVVGIVRGTMRGAMGDTNGHWITDVICCKKGELKVFHADSNSTYGNRTKLKEALRLYENLPNLEFIIDGDNSGISPEEIKKAKNAFDRILQIFEQGKYARHPKLDGNDDIVVHEISPDELINNFLWAIEQLLHCFTLTRTQGKCVMIQEAGKIEFDDIKDGLEVFMSKIDESIEIYTRSGEASTCKSPLNLSDAQREKLNNLLAEIEQYERDMQNQ